jgi:thiol-disulfide isomerase/thioredoxin
MQDLYPDTKVIKLTDKDFKITPEGVKLINKQFKSCDGYVMIYAPWFHYCQLKVELWTYLGDQFNDKKNHGNENFRIAVINSEDPKTSKIMRALGVSAFPSFMRASSDAKGNCDLSEYAGRDISPEELIMGVCEKSPKKKICKFNAKKL